MFSEARIELKELIDLVRDIERFDVALASLPDIEPTPEARAERNRKELRKLGLMGKYELI
ncbi:hypothetical protein D3C87_1873380 [compost metagenome]